ncbi:PIN domain-like protein [Armillaria novae-zelandiae]|uniref:PIN domain-like protein n=1 Tax=Armillaria novae-zelandiae TaxID=153914 RepID=A0AA39NJB4_9AGAR|nr:PIN domain-like protein [Armillaria novae-zelandiae]
MGIKGGWTLLNPVESVSLVDWANQKISSGAMQDLGPRIGVDASGWMFAAKYHHGQTKSPAQASLFKRIGRLFHLPVVPLFVFDGPRRPVNKRKKNITKTSDWLTADFKRLLDGFGFSYWEAPGEAEAELAMLSKLGLIDAVMSEDFDTMVFGAQRVIRIKEESDSQYLIEVYEAGSKFSRNNLVTIALLAGGDYDDGVQGCGIQTATNIAQSSIGERLFDAFDASEADNHAAVASTWRQDLCTMLEKRGAGRLHSRCRSLASRIPLDFPKVSVVIQYIHPITSQSNGPQNLPASVSLRQPNIPLLARLCEELFVWGNSAGIVQHFCDHVFPGLAIRELIQDLCKRRGLLPPNDTSISQHPMISRVCAVRVNQQERSQSEIFLSLVIPEAILTQITSAISGIYNTDITLEKYDRFTKKRQVHVWLSRVLALHARPNMLDDHQALTTSRKRKVIKPRIKQVKRHNMELSPVQPVASTSANVLDTSQDWAEWRRSASVLEISSDESGKETTEIAAPRKRQKRATSPKYRIEVCYSARGEVLEFCTDDEGL